jgi:hypothetical protein
LLGSPTFASVSASPSASVQDSVIATAVATRVRLATSWHTGAWVTVTVTVASADSAVPSLALYLNVSVPKKPAAGV